MAEPADGYALAGNVGLRTDVSRFPRRSAGRSKVAPPIRAARVRRSRRIPCPRVHVRLHAVFVEHVDHPTRRETARQQSFVDRDVISRVNDKELWQNEALAFIAARHSPA